MPFGLLDRPELVHLVDVGFVPPVDGQKLEGTSLLAEVAVGLVRIVEEVHVVPCTQAVLLDRVRLRGVDGHLEIGIVHGDEVAPSAFCTVVFDHYRLVDLPGVRYELGHGDTSRGDPLPLHVPVRLPTQYSTVTVRRNLQVPESAGTHVLHERSVRDDDHIPVEKLSRAGLELVEILELQNLVGLGQRECVIIFRAVSDGEPKCLEAHLPRSMEDL